MRWHLPLVTALGLLLPGRAAAFNDCGGGWFEIEALFADEVPADGILAFRGRSSGSLAALSLEVRPEGGAPIAGALEFESGIIVWRPAAPLTPGQPYTLHLHSDGSVDDEGCFSPPPPDLDLDAAFTAAAPGRPAPRWDAISASYRVAIRPSGDPADFVCCEGWSPERECGVLITGEGCAADRGFTELHTVLTLDPAAWGEAGGQLFYAPFDTDDTRDEIELVDAGPLPCVTLRASDLATGQVHIGPTLCPDDALASDLGERPLDPRDTLACQGPLEICEIDEFGEPDPARCRRWHAGCGCASASDGRPPSILLLALIALAVRRRGR